MLHYKDNHPHLGERKKGSTRVSDIPEKDC